MMSGGMGGAVLPAPNLVEGVWRRVKGFLMPRRYYDWSGRSA